MLYQVPAHTYHVKYSILHTHIVDSRSQSLSDVTFEFHAFLKHPVKPTVCSTKSETIRLHIGIQISIIINDLILNILALLTYCQRYPLS